LAGGCLDENAIVAFFESRLDDAASAAVDEHLAGCDACRRVLREYAKLAGPPTSLTEPEIGAPADEAPAAERTSQADEVADLARRVVRAQAQKRVGTTLAGRWKIERLIGIGGMAQVFAATHRNGRAVAVKIMRAELAVEAAFVERFLREGYVANKIEHPGAVAILDDDVTPDGVPFLVMELLTGCTLQERLRQGPLPVGEALQIADEVLDVLARAHDRGIVHRDIKPDNLFLTTDGHVKVLDFGIARLREQAAHKAHTRSGITMGTLGFMPPEQARGTADAVDGRSDAWALGATIYTLVTGKVVHDGPSGDESLLMAMTKPVPKTKVLAPALPDAVAALLDKALAFERRERFQDCREMQAAIRATGLARAPTPPGPDTLVNLPVGFESTHVATPVVVAPADAATRGDARRRAWPKIVAMALLGIAAGVLLATTRRGSPNPPTVAPPPLVAPSATEARADAPAVTASSEPPKIAADVATTDGTTASVPEPRPTARRPPPSARPTTTPTATPTPKESAAPDPLAPRR
jgi:eukaryotic-like serine/threonine-protein kinase